MRALASGTCLALLLLAEAAGAQPKAPGPSRSSSQFTLRREEPGGPDGQAARARSRAGDCAGALPGFDSAIRQTIDATLRRDRGLCHEKLGNPFPAIEDYRAYLTQHPDAADAESIRERLVALEGQVGQGGKATTRDGEEGGGLDAKSVTGKASVSVGGDGAKEESKIETRSPIIGPRTGEPERNYDYYATQEKLSDTAEESPLRRGSGAVFGVTLLPYRLVSMNPGLAPDGVGIGLNSVAQVGYSIAGSIRYSTGKLFTLDGEVGYAGFGTVGARSFGGLQTLLMGEFRIPFTQFAADQIHLGVGVGFERYGSAAVESGTNALLPRFRAGYRHVFGPTFGLDAFVDGGPAYFWNSSTDQFTAPYVSFGLALLIGGEGGT